MRCNRVLQQSRSGLGYSRSDFFMRGSESQASEKIEETSRIVIIGDDSSIEEKNVVDMAEIRVV